MKKMLLLIFCAAIIGFWGCGEKAKEIKDAADAMKTLQEASNTMEETQNAAQAYREERKKRGDTLAMPYAKLQEFLPATISSYERQEPEGESVNMGGMSFSQASVRFIKKNTDGSEAFVKVSLYDYNQTYEFYAGIIALWKAGYQKDDANSFERTFDPGIKNAGAFETFQKQNKEAKVTYALGYRFILDIEASNQTGGDFVKSIAQAMKMKELSEM